MRRIVLMVTVALVMAAMMAMTAMPAFATIHPLANSECADASASDVANDQLPPGLSPASVDPELTGKSQGSPPNNPFDSTLAQPVFAVEGGDDPFTDPTPSPAFKTSGANIESDFCPAAK